MCFAYDRSFRPTGHDDLNNFSPQESGSIYFFENSADQDQLADEEAP